MLTRHIYLIFECVWPSTRHSQMIFHFKWFHGMKNKIHKYSAKNWTQLMIQTLNVFFSFQIQQKQSRFGQKAMLKTQKANAEETHGPSSTLPRRPWICGALSAWVSMSRFILYRVNAHRPSNWFEFEIRSLLFTFICQCLRKQILRSFASEKKNRKKTKMIMIMHSRVQPISIYDHSSSAHIWFRVCGSCCALIYAFATISIEMWHSFLTFVRCSGAQYSWQTPRPRPHTKQIVKFNHMPNIKCNAILSDVGCRFECVHECTNARMHMLCAPLPLLTFSGSFAECCFCHNKCSSYISWTLSYAVAVALRIAIWILNEIRWITKRVTNKHEHEHPIDAMYFEPKNPICGIWTLQFYLSCSSCATIGVDWNRPCHLNNIHNFWYVSNRIKQTPFLRFVSFPFLQTNKL